MIPLAFNAPLESAASLCEAIRTGCAGKKLSVSAVDARSLDFPRLESLEIDLSGTQLNQASLFSEPSATPLETPTYQVERFSLQANPILWENIAADLDVKLSNARFLLAQESGGGFFLLLQETDHGSASVKVALTDLQAAAETWIKKAAAAQGAEIKRTTLKLHSHGPRAAEIELEVSAKIFVMTATLVIRGTVSIGDSAEIQFSGWTCTGESMITSAANALLKPRFEQLEKQRISLGALAKAGGFGSVEFSDLRMDCGEDLHLRAAW
jgi:hypothetical protein